MTRIKKFAAILAMLLAVKNVVAATGQSSATEEKPAVMVSADHPEFTIKLRSNPTTGYSWFLRDYDASLVRPVKHSIEKPTDKTLMGAPGYEVWTFRVKPEGFVVPIQTLMRFVYIRPWKFDGQAKRTVFSVATQPPVHTAR